MEATVFVFIVLFGIVLSDIFGSIFPWLPIPLIQIAFGALIALTPLDMEMSLNPEVFMGFVVAPLLFREAEESDILTLIRLRRPIILMAFLLVFITVFAVGGYVHWLFPAIPLAACFAFGAILGPTDMIAVSTISRRVNIPEKLLNALRGEGLINDSSGVIAFNFAILALRSGEFSFASALGSFLFMCIGGLVIGLILVLLKDFAFQVLGAYHIRTHSVHLIIEVALPFICFLTAEHLGCSGIIAAVTAGSRAVFRRTRMDLHSAQFNASRRSLWEMIYFMLNSFVFLLLGLQLPGIIREVIDHKSIHIGYTTLAAISIALAMFLVRFVALLLIANSITGSGKERLRDTLILTLSGVKGTVSLATAFALPIVLTSGLAFSTRSTLLYMTGVVIMFSLILSLLLLPRICKEGKTVPSNAAKVAVLQDVVAELKREDNEYMGAVIVDFNNRIRSLERGDIEHTERREFLSLLDFVEETERGILERKRLRREISDHDYTAYRRMLSLLHENEDKGMFERMRRWMRRTQVVIAALFNSEQRRVRKANKVKNKAARAAEIARQAQEVQDAEDAALAAAAAAPGDVAAAYAEIPAGLPAEEIAEEDSGPVLSPERRAFYKSLKKLEDTFWDDTNLVIEALERQRGRYSDEVINQVIKERIDLAGQVMEGVYGGAIRARLHDEYEGVLLRGFAIERQKIDEHLAAGRLSPKEADEMRVSVNALETFALTDHTSYVLPKFIAKTIRPRIKK
ncbi:MAG: sodium:proton antiporter [Clostridiales Family XIII bacterium]|nr:sodium:proton antiporter [Clostridiales Family XIII bacterium]